MHFLTYFYVSSPQILRKCDLWKCQFGGSPGSKVKQDLMSWYRNSRSRVFISFLLCFWKFFHSVIDRICESSCHMESAEHNFLIEQENFPYYANNTHTVNINVFFPWLLRAIIPTLNNHWCFALVIFSMHIKEIK